MTPEQQAEAIAKAVRAYVTRTLEPLVARIEKIERKGVAYRGIFNRADEYERGDLVTFAGSLFCAVHATQGVAPAHADNSPRPLDHPWQLAARRGRDAHV